MSQSIRRIRYQQWVSFHWELRMSYRELLHRSIALILVAALVACSEPLAGPDTSADPGPSAASIVELAVSNVTTGGAFDPDGFWISIDGNATYRFDLNETFTFRSIADGSHTVL